MMNINCDGPSVVKLELGVVGQDFGRRGAGILNLDATVGDEGGGVQRERSVGVKVIFAVLPNNDGGGATWIGCCEGKTSE
jgi:hypothetical protein